MNIPVAQAGEGLVSSEMIQYNEDWELQYGM